MQFYGEDAGHTRAVLDQAVADIRRLEAKYSRYRPDSRLSALNRVAAAGGRLEVDPETAALLDYAAACQRESGGLFDITSGVLRHAWDFASGRPPEAERIQALLPRVGWDKLDWDPPYLGFRVPGMELDLGGIGKEYAADRAVGLCLAAGLRHGFVNLGGDLRIAGPQPNGQPWPIGIRDPFHPRKPLGGLALLGGALASSGDYVRGLTCNGLRYGHILDPRTGWPVQGLVAVSVLADSCLVAGSACTIALLQGDAGAAWLSELGLPHLWVDRAGRRGGSGSLGGLSSPPPTA